MGPWPCVVVGPGEGHWRSLQVLQAGEVEDRHPRPVFGVWWVWLELSLEVRGQELSEGASGGEWRSSLCQLWQRVT